MAPTAANLSPARWAATQTPVALMVIRLLLVANAVVLVVCGALCLAFFAEPARVAGTVLLWGAGALLLALVPYTNPRRGERTTW